MQLSLNSIKKFIGLIILSCLTITCRSVQSSAVLPTAVSVVTVVDDPKVPDSLQNIVYAGLRMTETVFEFYKYNDFKMYWWGNGLSRPAALSLIETIATARRFGLLPQHYHAAEVSVLSSKIQHSDILRLDIILTDAFFSLSHDLKNGRLKSKPVAYDSVSMAFLRGASGINIKSFFESQQPPHAGYHSLRHVLNTMLDTLNLAQKNLLMSGITLDSIEAHRHVRQLEINMDRWRAEKEPMGDQYVWINIPSFILHVMEQERSVFTSRIIVGTPVTPTPEFSSNIECMSVFPYWYLPRKIAVNEYLPVIKKDTTFITRNNLDVLDKKGNIVPLTTIDWRQYNPNNFPFTLRQREGRENALGIIKFIFDNPYAVYLHDTNSKRLFNKQTRALSHGCIRLEKAVEFAHYLIRDNRSVISSEKLDTYLKQQKRITISLLKSVPIHTRYLTAEVKDGRPVFYPDIYKRDVHLIEKIYNEMLY